MSEPVAGEISGFPTTTFTVDVGDRATCNEFSCLDFALVEDSRNSAEVPPRFGKGFDRGFVYEVHWVEHPEGPVVFVIGTPDDDMAWFDTARAVVDTITLG